MSPHLHRVMGAPSIPAQPPWCQQHRYLQRGVLGVHVHPAAPSAAPRAVPPAPLQHGGGQEAPQHLRSPLSLQPPRWVWNPIARDTPAVCLSAHIRTAGRGGTRRGGEEEGKGGAEGFGRVSLH